MTSETAGVGVIDLDQMTLTKTIPLGEDGPRGLSLNADGTRLLLANKETADLSEIDTSTGKVVRRVKIGKNPEFVRVFKRLRVCDLRAGRGRWSVRGPPGARRGAKEEKGADER